MTLMIFYLILSFIGLSSPQNYIALIFQNNQVQIMSNNIFESQFVLQTKQFSCTSTTLYILKQTPTQYQNNSPYTLQIDGLSDSINVKIASTYQSLFPTINSNTCSSPSCRLQIVNNCPILLTDFNYFDIINLQIGNLQTISFYVVCDKTYVTQIFEWGSLILIVIVITIIIIASIFGRFNSFSGGGIVYSWVMILIFNVSLIVGGLLIVFAIKVADIVADIFSWVLGIAAVTIITMEFLFFAIKSQKIRKSFSIKGISIRILDLVSGLVGLTMVVIWWVTSKNWIVTDVISICIIVSTIKVFKFTSFKLAFAAYLITICVEIAILITIQNIDHSSYQGYLLNNINNPFQLQIPSINHIIGEKCSWLSVNGVIYPGLLIAYLYRFDKSKNIKIYLITASSAFFVGSLVWWLLGTFIQFAFPFGIISEPIMMICFGLFAFKRKELRTLWEGRFYDEEFLNKESVQNMQNQFEKEVEAPDYFKENLMKGLDMNYMEDSQLEEIPDHSLLPIETSIQNSQL